MMPRPPSEPGLFASADARRMFWLCAALLFLCALALNMRALDFGFLYLRDDDVNVTVNRYMGRINAERLGWMFTDSSYVRRYIPLGWLNFAATYQFAGLDPRPYHAVALGLYAVNCVLVLALVAHALRAFAPAKGLSGLTAWEVGAAALAAGWWAFHPFRVETTAWVSGNLYGQSVAFLLASLIAYLRSYGAAGRARAAWLLAAVAGFTASLLTYPLALGVPFLLIGMDWLRSRSHPSPPFRRLLAEKSAFLVPLAAVFAVTVAARFGSAQVYGAVPGMRDLSLMSRVAQSCYIAVYYVWKPWWPFNLSPLYDTLVDFNPWGATFVLSMAAVAAASALALASFRRRPAFAVIWFGYLAVAAPFFGLTEKPHVASDRYGYFLTVIMAALLAAAVARISAPRARALATFGALALICGLGRLSWRQLDVWSSDQVQHAYVAARLTNAEILDDFTSRLLILDFMRGKEKQASAAVAARLAQDPQAPGYRRAASIIADKRRVESYYGPVTLLAIIQDQTAMSFAAAGDLREADDHLEDALRMDDRFYQAAYDRALVLLKLGRGDEALRSFLLSERWASPPLKDAQRREFLGRLEREGDAEGRPLLSAAARAALSR
jgi:hypothetical protein